MLGQLSNFVRWQKHLIKLTLDSHYREIHRLSKLRRYERATTDLLGRPFAIADARTFLAQYRDIVEERLYEFVSDDDEPIIIDLGANIGVSVWSFKRLYPRSRVIAFEPDRGLFRILADNVRRLGLEKVELFEQAAWSMDGEVTFFAEGSDSGRAEIPLDGQNYKVRSASVRPWLAQRVAMLKIDIEGAETTVMEDIADLLKNVDNVLLEYHSFAGQPQMLPRMLTILQDAEFRIDLRSVRGSPRPFVMSTIVRGMDFQVNIFGYRHNRAEVVSPDVV